MSGEESVQQIKMRADRMGLKADDLYLLTETNLADIFEQVNRVDPVNPDHRLDPDGVFTRNELHGRGRWAGARVRQPPARMLAKSTGICVFIIGHVTKDGMIAGPRVLEHVVDTVLYLEGDRFQTFRLLRCGQEPFWRHL